MATEQGTPKRNITHHTPKSNSFVNRVVMWFEKWKVIEEPQLDGFKRYFEESRGRFFYAQKGAGHGENIENHAGAGGLEARPDQSADQRDSDMSKKRKKRRDTVRTYSDPEYRKSQLDAMREPFARMYQSLLTSDQYKALTGNAKNLYVCMLSSCKGDYKFTFPRKVYTEFGFSAQSFREAKDLLSEAGFITEQKQFKAESIFRLSTEWMVKEPRQKVRNWNNLEATKGTRKDPKNSI